MYNVILVAYSEIGLKSPPVRNQLERQLLHHILNILRSNGLSGSTIRRIQGRLLIENTPATENTAQIIAQVFGVAASMPAIHISTEFENIIETVRKVAKNVIKPHESFAIDARRTGEHSFSSRDLEVAAGHAVEQLSSLQNVTVNLKQPNKTIHLEVRGNETYIYHQIFSGVAGLPFGSQGKIVSLFSGGIDSPVASWLMMKRGCFPLLLFCDQQPHVGPDYFQRALEIARVIRRYVPLKRYYLHTVPMGFIMDAILETVSPRFVCICCKRMMYRLASHLANQLHCQGLVTGENLGQVASQTLSNLRVLDEAVSLPVFRPLIGYEKLETIQLAKQIGTFQLSTTSVHGCTAVPSKPSTKAKLNIIKEFEKGLDIPYLISRAYEGNKRIEL
jgi:thiamine biosynthesis protein ThiI